MRSAPVMAPDAKIDEGRQPWPSASGTLLAWEADSTPRLQPSDLSNPAVYYRRLEAWIMKQK